MIDMAAAFGQRQATFEEEAANLVDDGLIRLFNSAPASVMHSLG